MPQAASKNVRDTASKIDAYTAKLSAELRDMREAVYPPEARKTFAKTFSTMDLARLLAVPESTLRQLTIEGKGPMPERAENNRRTYTVEQVKELRSFLASLRLTRPSSCCPIGVKARSCRLSQR